MRSGGQTKSVLLNSSWYGIHLSLIFQKASFLFYRLHSRFPLVFFNSEKKLKLFVCLFFYFGNQLFLYTKCKKFCSGQRIVKISGHRESKESSSTTTFSRVKQQFWQKKIKFLIVDTVFATVSSWVSAPCRGSKLFF